MTRDLFSFEQDDIAPHPGTRVAPLTVTQLNESVDLLLRSRLGAVWVGGELSRVTIHRSGHWYFTLTDGTSSVSCAMFRGRNSAVTFTPKDGLAVLLLASTGVYAPQGRYQLVAEAMEPLGQGAAALALEQLKQKLAAEGLFAAERKQPLPPFPKTLGLVTSRDGAALRDVLRVLRRRFAGLDLLLAPVAVQGKESPAEIVAGLQALDRRGLDVLLLVRGGGAKEDLAAFDTESVVRAIASCRTPVVTGIGHEIDLTLADLASDVSAATPSQAAELVVRERAELCQRVRQLRVGLARVMRHRLQRSTTRVLQARSARGLPRVPQRVSRLRWRVAEASKRLEDAQGRFVARAREQVALLTRRMAPTEQLARLRGQRQAVQQVVTALSRSMIRELGRRRRNVTSSVVALETLSPLAVLGRGYALVTRGSISGEIIDDSSRLQRGETLYLRLAQGGAEAVVTQIDPPDEGEHP
ncbi:MAG: exodeoxyribonuclease VII large subunit [Acidobacteriota bacterium]